MRFILFLVAASLWGQAPMTQTALTFDVGPNDFTIVVNSATGIVAPGPGGQGRIYLYVDSEMMSVEGVSGTALRVIRGVNGTVSTAHNAAAVVYAGTADKYASSIATGACTSTSWPVTPRITASAGAVQTCSSGVWSSTTGGGGGGSGVTVQVGGSSLPSQPVATVNFTPGFGVLLAGSTSAGVSTVQVTAESGPFTVTTLPAAGSNSGRTVLVSDCTSASVLGAGGGSVACVARSNGTSWLVAAPFTLTTTGSSGAATFSGGTLNIPQYSGGSSYYFASQGRTNDITPAINTWTDVYTIADVPALAAGACYIVEHAMGGTDATVNAYDTRIVMGTGGTQIINWAGGTEKYKLIKFSICNDPGTQTAQTMNDLGSGYNTANNAGVGVAPVFPPPTHSAISANFSAPFTLRVQVQTATASKTFRGFFVRISQ